MEVKNVKGTHDIIGDESSIFIAVENLMRHVAELFAFSEVRPPVLEHSELFVRGVGESSDIVRKEMYTFDDKGGRSLTLRPEFTAGIMRLIVQNKLYATNELPLKYYYLGPVFRYERPQLGRYRQFNQFGVESVGSNNPLADVETIVLAYTILQSLGLENVQVKINTLGDEESRNSYREALKNYFKGHIENMCPDCKSRFELNPLRILDCKVPEDQVIVKDAPKMSEFLSKASKERFDYILKTLDELQIPYEVDDTLVRGLDYYSDTVYEFHYTSAKGNNYGAIGAGGHYDRLMSELGGPNLPGVGFSFGIERIASVLQDDEILPEDLKEGVNFYVMPMGKDAQIAATLAADAVRMSGVSVDVCFDDVKLNAMFKRAEKKNAKFAIIIGDEELKRNVVVIKNLKTKEQITVPMEELCEKASELIEGEHEDCCCGHDHEHEEDHCCCGHDHEHDHEHEEDHCCCGHNHEHDHEHEEGHCCCGEHHHKENE